MLKDKLPDLYQIFTFPRKLVQINNSAISPASPVTPMTPTTPYGLESDKDHTHADAENPISPSAIKPDTGRVSFKLH